MIEYQSLDADNFAFTIPKAHNPGTPYQELLKITKTLPSKISVLASGGVDNEVMIRWLTEHGKQVTAVCYRVIYNGVCINDHDIAWVRELENICDISYENFNIEHFYESKWFWEFIDSYKCTSPQLAFQAYITQIESHKRFTILTAIHPEPKYFNNDTFIQIREKDFAAQQACAKHNCLVSPLQSNSEIYAALLGTDEFKNFSIFGIADGRSRKSQQYFDWFGIKTKVRPKYHGFEGSEKLDNGMRKKIFDKCGYSECHMYVPYKTLLDNLLNRDMTYRSNELDKYIRVLHKTHHSIGPAQ